MKTIVFSPTLLTISLSLFLLASSLASAVEEPQQQAHQDTGATKSGVKPASKQASPFKPLPPFYPGRDTAGFQLIPIYPEMPSLQVRSGIGIEPAQKTPVLIKEVTPVYPDSAKALHLEGTVRVLIWVDRVGAPREVSLLDDPPEIFRQPAREAAWKFRFMPGPDLGVFSYEFHFRLPKGE